MLSLPEEKNTTKVGGEYHYTDSVTEHQISPCNQSAFYRAIKPGFSTIETDFLEKSNFSSIIRFQRYDRVSTLIVQFYFKGKG